MKQGQVDVVTVDVIKVLEIIFIISFRSLYFQETLKRRRTCESKKAKADEERF